MTIESLPGSVTAPDPLEVENDALRAEVERLKAALVASGLKVVNLEASIGEVAHETWDEICRDYFDALDSEGFGPDDTHGDFDSRLPWGQRMGGSHALALKAVATLTAERDSLRTRIENAEAGSVVAKALIDRLTAERDALKAGQAEVDRLVKEELAASLADVRRVVAQCDAMKNALDSSKATTEFMVATLAAERDAARAEERERCIEAVFQEWSEKFRNSKWPRQFDRADIREACERGARGASREQAKS